MEIKSSEFPNRIADPPLYISVWNQPIVVEFFQDNCQTCADLVWQEIGEVTHDVVIASYDCTENWTAGQICGDMKIKHTPELVYIEPGKDARLGPRYNMLEGEFTIERFRTWLDSVKTAPASGT